MDPTEDRTHPFQWARRRYTWTGQYADGTERPQGTGPDGQPESVAVLDFARLRRLTLCPTLTGYPPVTVTADLAAGERIIKFWQVDSGNFGGYEVREVLGIQKTVNGVNVKWFVLFQTDGRIFLQTSENIDVPQGPLPEAWPKFWCTCDRAGTCLGCEIEKTVQTVHDVAGLAFLRAHLTMRPVE